MLAGLEQLRAAATQAIRLVRSGLFDAYPWLKTVLGHLGETLPFLVRRVDLALTRPARRP
jgi:predicted TIM-barrel fold metal-dependent hydrolase